MLGGLASRWFPVRSLDRVGAGAFVDLPVHVVSPNAVELALVDGVRAAVVRWTLLYEHTPYRGRQSSTGISHLVGFVGGWRGGRLLVRASCGRTIDVALETAHLAAPVDPEDGVPLGTTPKSAREYGEAARRAPPGAGLVFVREHPITEGQSLGLRARVVPTARVGGGYRDAPTDDRADFRTEGDVVLTDAVLG